MNIENYKVNKMAAIPEEVYSRELNPLEALQTALGVIASLTANLAKSDSESMKETLTRTGDWRATEQVMNTIRRLTN